VFRLATEKDPELVRRAALLLEQENRKLIEKVVELQRALLAAQGKAPEALQLELARLEQQLAQRTHDLFGRSSEKRPAPESEGESGDESGATPKDGDTRRRRDGKPARPGHGPHAQPALPRATTVHTLDAPDCVCPKCGDPLAVWDGQFETSEQVDVLERRFVLRTHQRQKHRCRCGHIETALGPDTVVDGGRYSIDFAVEVASDKYLDHAPLERQVRAMARQGLVVEAQTLFDQLWWLTRPLVTAYERLHTYVLSAPVVLADETRWPLLGSDGVEQAPPSRWYLWAVARADAVFYKVYDTRGQPAGADLLAGYRGVVVADGYAVYDALAKRAPGVKRAACWVHARREFVRIEAFFPVECGVILAKIGDLYALERGIPPGPDGDAARRVVRATRSREVLAGIQAWCLETKVLPGSGLADAIRYVASRWQELTRFVDDPQIPLDSNGVERALRGPVVGRKNHYGSRSLRGLEVAAILYTLLETAKLAGVDPKVYLRRAVAAGRRGERVPLPHELRELLEAERRAAGGGVASGETPAQ
jgi:transposase